MKASPKKLGFAIQLYLLKQGVSVDQLAQEMGLNADSLSNLIHGRRKFKNDTLARLADTPTFQKGQFSLNRLRAFRAMDEYNMEELLLAILEFIRQGEVDDLDESLFQRLRQELELAEFPASFQEKRRKLLELMR